MRWIGIVLFCVLVTSAATASATTVELRKGQHYWSYKGSPSYDAYGVVVTDDGGAADRLTMTVSRATATVSDDGVALRAGPGCAPAAKGAVRCADPLGNPLERNEADLGGGDDRALVRGQVTVDGGDGDDTLVGDQDTTLTGGTGADTFRGSGTVSYADRITAVAVIAGDGPDDGAPGEHDDVGTGLRILGGPEADLLVGSAVSGGAGDDVIGGTSGADVLRGGDGDDRIDGGAGDDLLFGEAGADELRGGAGTDTVSYDDSIRAGVTVTLDDRPGDGSPGEDDDVGSDVERVLGSFFGPLTITGNDGPNVLVGDAGRGGDHLSGLGGDDQLSASGPDSTLDGGPGDDVLAVGSRGERAVGGPGHDRFVISQPPAGVGAFAGAPAAYVDAADGESDVVDCGVLPYPPDGRFDAIDDISSCTAAPAVQIAARVRVSPTARVSAGLSCPTRLAPGPTIDLGPNTLGCAGVLRLLGIAGTGPVAYRMDPGATTRVALHLTPAAVRSLRHARARRAAIATVRTSKGEERHDVTLLAPR